MANKKAPGKSSKVVSKTAKGKSSAKSKPPVQRATSALREEERVEVEMAARYGVITEAQAAAFASQFKVANAEKRGHATKAKDVLREVRGWLPIIHRVLGNAVNVRYTAARFVFLLMSIDALARELDASAKGGARC